MFLLFKIFLFQKGLKYRVATSYDSKEFCQKYKLPTLIDMENLAPQTNENSKFISIIDGQDTLDFDKNLDDNGKYSVYFFFLRKI